MSRRAIRTAFGAALAACLVVIVGPSTASSAVGGPATAPDSKASAATLNEALVHYLPGRRLPIRMKCPPGSGAGHAGKYHCLNYLASCSADCKVKVRTKLVLPGLIIGPVVASESFDADEIFVAYIVLRRPQRAALKANRSEARLRTRISATDLATNETDVDRRTYRFKHG